jgi:hypothetical protein
MDFIMGLSLSARKFDSI